MNIIIDSTFNPFSYKDLMQPVYDYKKAYEETEAAYSDLVTQTEAWKDIANREKSPEAYAMYKRYSDQLNAIVDDFSQGMNPRNRRQLLGMKKRYAQDIASIARASEAMNAANELRAKAGPDAIFEVGEYNSLDQFLHGKTANNRYQSKEALTKQTAVMTEAAMAEAMKDPEFQKEMGDQYWLIKQHTGGSYEELLEAMKLGMMDNPIAKNRFSQIRQEMMKKAGINNYDAKGQEAIISAIDLGLYAGLDKPTMQFQANQAFIPPSRGGGSRRGSSYGRGPSNSGQDEWEEPEDVYVANDIIYEQSSSGRWSVPTDMNPSDSHGYLTNYENLGRAQKQIVDKHLAGSDPRQYEFYTWRTSSGGKSRVQIKRKQSYTKPGPATPATRNNPSNNYLNE